jgi:hypothetical protein
MSGLPNRNKAISLNAISSVSDSVRYPSGSYCIPPGIDGEFLISDSTSATGFGWTELPEYTLNDLTDICCG